MPLVYAVGRAGACFGAVHSLVPPPARRVPAKHRHLLPLLKRLIGAPVAAPCCVDAPFLRHSQPWADSVILS